MKSGNDPKEGKSKPKNFNVNKFRDDVDYYRRSIGIGSEGTCTPEEISKGCIQNEKVDGINQKFINSKMICGKIAKQGR